VVFGLRGRAHSKGQRVAAALWPTAV